MRALNVLSLFDGMSCGHLALDRAGWPVANYYASEIDRHAIQVTQANYPDTVQLGDVTRWREWAIDWASIDIVLAGSPCQGFSFAGKQLAFDDPRSALFFVFVEIWRHVQAANPAALFLLENVRMKKEHELVISNYMGVTPLAINSSLVSAQSRYRLYWTNISAEPYGMFGGLCCGIPVPEDRGITWGSIRQHDAPKKHYYSPVALAWMERHSKAKNKKLRIWADTDKCQMIEASHHKNYSAQRFFGIEDVHGLRYITPLECERAQTVPDGYTAHVSDTQRYRMLGNGWTVDVIAHILKHITQ